MPTIALLSPGNMGHAIGKLLVSRNFDVVTCLAGRSERTRRLAKLARLRELSTLSNVAAEAELVLSIMPPAAAVGAAQELAAALSGVGRTLTYADCNAIAPDTSRRIAAIITATGSSYVDASIVGGPPARGKGPRLYVSGPDASTLAALDGGGLTVRDLGAEVGRASALKMCYAALTKGTSALQLALLTAASRLGVGAELDAELQASQRERHTAMQRSLPRLPARAHRWIEEMRQIASTLEAAGVPGGFHRGAAEMYELLSQTPFAAENEEAVDESRTLEATVAALAAVIATGHSAAPATGA